MKELTSYNEGVNSASMLKSKRPDWSMSVEVFPTALKASLEIGFTLLAWHKLMFSMSEKELGKKWDRCLADAAIKLGKYSRLFFVKVTLPCPSLRPGIGI